MGVWAAVALLSTGTSATASAPVGIRVDVVSAYTDNLFRTYTRRADWIQQLFVDLDYQHERFDAYYSGQANSYAEYGDLFTQTHVLGVALARPGAQRQLLTAGLELIRRDGTEDYAYKDYTAASLYGSGKLYLRPNLMLRTGGAVDVRRYTNASDFSYAEPHAYLQLSRFYATRTTVLAGVEAGVKHYLQAASDAGTSEAYGRDQATRTLTQIAAWVKLAQSVGPTTGVQLQLRRQATLTGTTRYRQPEDYDPVEELFDDGYSYSGDRLYTAVKHRHGQLLQVLASAHAEVRRYDGRPALTLDGLAVGTGETRRDVRQGALVRLDVAPGYAPGPVRQLSLSIETSVQRVDSNDPYYDAVTRIHAATIRCGF